MPDAPKVLPLRPRYNPPPKAKTAERGYGTAHQKARARRIAEDPVCQHCREAWATDLHHVDGNPFNRDPANLLMVCERCHHAGGLHGR